MPKTLLLADDSVTIQKVVGISLANEDIELVTVENGDDAVTKAEEVRPDIVLADIVMPGKNGYEVCEAIKTDPNLSATPVLLLTGTFEAFDAERARQVGADGHITKPFEAQALVDQVNQLLARSTPIGETDARPASAAQATPAPAPPADVGAHGEGGDAFDFFDGNAADADTSWPTAAAQADGDGLDLMADTSPSGPTGQADETILLDPSQGSGDPAFDAAVEAAAFDAPAERRPLQADDSGFDLESADLSMASTVPEVAVAPGSMSFSDPGADDLTEPPIAPAPILDAGPILETAPITDPLLDFDPVGEARSAADETVLDPTPVQSFDVVAPAEDLGSSDTTQPGSGYDTLEDASETVMIVEDANPVRVQAPGDHSTTAPAATPVGTEAPAVSPALEQHLHSALEKIAWEAFSDISEQVVKQVLARVEAVAWEVIPQMAEVLVKEEIAKMQGGGSEED
ncbi:MAG: response regulator [Deltaproteobacteria bacterium]|nr:response regulator [Deltaproteobacteria bacterium]MBW2445070.1 response regulator [Deltaproteobacteria bacterium]